MSGGRAPRKGLQRPVLVTAETVEVDTGSRGSVLVARFRRGALMAERRSYDSAGAWLNEFAEPTRRKLERMCERLRDQLEESGLPSDRTPNWIRKPGGDWEPCDALDQPPGPGVSYAHWTWIIEQRTEPLTSEREASSLLQNLARLLDRDGIDQHLWDIARVMQSYAALKMVGPINNAAAVGIAGEKGRSAGPKVRRERAGKARSVIRDCVRAAWSKRPTLKYDASNTAAHISTEVNNALRSQSLLPRGKDGLSVKTIADHIREMLRGQLL